MHRCALARLPSPHRRRAAAQLLSQLPSQPGLARRQSHLPTRCTHLPIRCSSRGCRRDARSCRHPWTLGAKGALSPPALAGTLTACTRASMASCRRSCSARRAAVLTRRSAREASGGVRSWRRTRRPPRRRKQGGRFSRPQLRDRPWRKPRRSSDGRWRRRRRSGGGRRSCSRRCRPRVQRRRASGCSCTKRGAQQRSSHQPRPAATRAARAARAAWAAGQPHRGGWRRRRACGARASRASSRSSRGRCASARSGTRSACSPTGQVRLGARVMVSPSPSPSPSPNPSPNPKPNQP